MIYTCARLVAILNEVRCGFLRFLQAMTATCFHTNILCDLFNPENGAKTWVDFQQATWSYIPEDSTLHYFK